MTTRRILTPKLYRIPPMPVPRRHLLPSRGSAHFNNDGDPATDADIEAFFRVLAGGPC
jgi:hypothetical protein